MYSLFFRNIFKELLMVSNKRIRVFMSCMILFSLVIFSGDISAQDNALNSITAKELHTHLNFIASDEMKGRDTPSPELKMAAKYLAAQVESYGLKPVMFNNSYFQSFDVEISSVDQNETTMEIASGSEKTGFKMMDDFTVSSSKEIFLSGDVVFIGLGVSAPDKGWDDLKDINIKDKIVFILDGNLPEDNELRKSNQYRYRQFYLPRLGAAAVFTIVNNKTEKDFEENGTKLRAGRSSKTAVFRKNRGNSGRRRSSRVTGIVRQKAAADILGISINEIKGMFDKISAGNRVESMDITGKKITCEIKLEKKMEYTRNVVAMVEGTDPVLKNEYVVFGAHYDHTGVNSRGEIYNGADDDGSGTVALLELAQAYMMEKPKRSMIFVWHSGEEKGLWGSDYFTSNSPVPIEKISGMLNVDMCSRNDPNSIYIIGSHFLSDEMDQITKKMNEKYVGMKLDEEYNVKGKRGNFYRQSDHYNYGRYGIPVIFYFSGTHPDLHRPTDTVEKCDFKKMEKTTRLVYVTGREIANLDHMLVLDKDIKKRGKPEDLN